MFGDSSGKNLQWYKNDLEQKTRTFHQIRKTGDDDQITTARIEYQSAVVGCHGILTAKEIVDILEKTEREATNEQAQGQNSLQFEARR